ncbi:hypothetical protein NKJ87_11715 [Mesorhizobium sp. M0027]|uniref:hypothetical protein n=1 Tax=Mesorhizobium sp. M0027 TaxID=2956848 RepID=UPI003339C8E0
MNDIGCLGFAWKRLSRQLWSVRLAPVRGVLVGLAVLLFSAGAPDADEGKAPLQDHPERRGLGVKLAGKSSTNTEATPGPDASAAPTIEWGRSLFVRKAALLKQISFTAVMDQLAASSGGKIADRNELFRNWWKTAAGDECEELRPKQPNGGPPFSYDCSRAEGMLKDKDPYKKFGDDKTPPFIIIAAVNRVDLLRDSLGGDCGEFRIIAGKHPDWENPAAPDGIHGEMLIAFEAVMPNGGKPERCMAIQKFWLSLSENRFSDDEVAGLLRRFFLEGITLAEDGSVVDGDAVGPTTFQLPPAMHVDHLGASESSTGQIRTNSKLHGEQWGLREYRFDKPSTRLLPTRTTGSPEPTLFSKNSPDPEATNKLVELIAKSIRTDGSAPGPLLDPNINSFHLLPSLPEHLLAAEMNAEDRSLGDYAKILDTEGHPDLIGEIEGGATRTLTAEQIRKRIQSLSCAGCHQFSRTGNGGFTDDFKREVCWQISSENKHVTTESTDGEYEISDALKFVFLPHREFVMRKYLAGKYIKGAYWPGNDPKKEDMSNDAQAASIGLPHC